MKCRLAVFLKYVFFAIIVLPIADKHLLGQFPVLLVDTAVRNRLAEEWEPTNRYQHERGYCVSYTEGYVFQWTGPLVVYRLTKVRRAQEEGTTGTSIHKMSCPSSDSSWIFLHTHPPTGCGGTEESCELGGEYANQCFPSQTDMGTLNKSDKPFGLIQCDEHAIAPFWRTAPLPLDRPPIGAHR